MAVKTRINGNSHAEPDASILRIRVHPLFESHMKKAKPSPEKQKWLDSVLFDAVDHRDISTVRWALDNGAQVNALDDLRNTALIKAVRNNDVEITGLLISRNADVNMKNRYGDAALNEASMRDNTGIAKMLLDNRADVDTRDIKDWTPLMDAAIMGHANMARFLIFNGADKDAVNDNGQTSWDCAIEFRNIEFAKLLEEHGAKPTREAQEQPQGLLLRINR